MQTMNAHFNFAKLGGVADEYAANFYGESTSALHKGTPTDRLVVSWHITAPHVVRRLEQPPELRMRAQEVGEAPVVNTTVMDGKWRMVKVIDLTVKERRLWIEIPAGLHRDAAGGAGARAAMAPARAADVPGVFREGLSRGRFRASARGRLRTLSSGP